MWLTSAHHACTFCLSRWFPSSGLYCVVGRRHIKGSLHPSAEKYIKNVYFITIRLTHPIIPRLPILCGIQDPEGRSLFAMLHAWLSSWFTVFDQVYLLSDCFFSPITRYWVHKLQECWWVELFTQKNIAVGYFLLRFGSCSKFVSLSLWELFYL